jgi:hypothetical protein
MAVNIPWIKVTTGGGKIQIDSSQLLAVVHVPSGGTPPLAIAPLSMGLQSGVTSFQLAPPSTTSVFYRVFSASDLAADAAANVGIAQNVQFVTATTGFSIPLDQTQGRLIIKAAGALATGTILLPTPPAYNQVIFVSSDVIVTSLTVTPGSGYTFPGAPTTLTANTGYAFVFESATATWHKCI